MTLSINVNGVARTVEADGETPLLYVLRNDLNLKGARFGCGIGSCGACTVVIGDKPVQSCDIALEAVKDQPVTTLEGIGGEGKLHALQQAFIDEQAAQCGYCASGMIMTAADLLNRNRQPQEADVRAALADNLCRCGTHNRIVRAVLRAAKGTA